MSGLVVARSMIPAVGSPPTQKNASMVPSFTACTDSLIDSCCLLMSLSGLSPAASSMRLATTWVPELGGPSETRLPFRSATFPAATPGATTTCA